jgi:hypothetical protein
MVAQVEPDAQLHPALSAGAHHVQSLGHVNRHGFLHQDMLAGVCGHLGVQGIRNSGGDKDGLTSDSSKIGKES